MKILDVKVDNLSRELALAKVVEFLKDDQQHIITTPNPEIILEAQKDEEFKKILNQADLALPDGFGLLLVSKILGEPIKERVTGTDFMQDICALAEKMEKSVFLLGGQEGVASQAALELSRQYPLLKIVGAEMGINFSDYNSQFPIAENNKLIKNINRLRPDIIFVAFGHKKQEKWIAENLKKIPSVKIAMGVGGAFDFIAKVVPRAPFWMRRLGLEWLFRFIKQPWRWRRIYRAVIEFPITVIMKVLSRKQKIY
jgi:N-acetylglucosaminyldiphosphoundecaprenol N-acetyl-beta-D-mannosaminyltransferase